jgi:hypothetical protein
MVRDGATRLLTMRITLKGRRRDNAPAYFMRAFELAVKDGMLKKGSCKL